MASNDWRINTQMLAVDADDAEILNLNPSNVTFYSTIIDMSSDKYIDYDVDLKKYIKIQSSQYLKTIDQVVEAPPSGSFTEENTNQKEAKICSLNDFKQAQLSTIPKNMKPICFGDLQNYEISQTKNGINQKQISLSITNCDGTGGVLCETDQALIMDKIQNLQIQIFAVTNQANFSSQNTASPLVPVHKLIAAFSPNLESSTSKQLFLQRNDVVIDAYENQFFSLLPQDAHTFNKVGKLKDIFYRILIGPQTEHLVLVKEYKIWLDLIACLGGALYFSVAILSLIMWPISELSFRSLAIQKMYKFKKSDDADNEHGRQTYSELEISFLDKCQIFVKNYICFCLKMTSFGNSKKSQVNSIVDIYDTGLMRLSVDTSFEKSIDQLRELKTISTDLYKSEKLKNRLKHNPQKVIDDIQSHTVNTLTYTDDENDIKDKRQKNWFWKMFKFKKKATDSMNVASIAPKQQENSPRFAQVRQKIEQMDEQISRYQSERSMRRSQIDQTSMGQNQSFISNTNRRLLKSNRSQSALEKNSPFKTRNFSLGNQEKTHRLKDNSNLQDQTKITVDSFDFYEKDEFELQSNPKTEIQALQEKSEKTSFKRIKRPIPEPTNNNAAKKAIAEPKNNNSSKNSLSLSNINVQPKEEQKSLKSQNSQRPQQETGKPPVQKSFKEEESQGRRSSRGRSQKDETKSNQRMQKLPSFSEDKSQKDKKQKVSNVTITVSMKDSDKSKKGQQIPKKEDEKENLTLQKNKTEPQQKSDEGLDPKIDQWSDSKTNHNIGEETRGQSKNSKRIEPNIEKNEQQKLQKAPSSDNILTLEQIANDQFVDIEPVDEEEDFDYSGEGEGIEEDGDSGELNIDSYLQSEIHSSQVQSTRTKTKTIASKKIKSKSKSRKKKKKNTPR